MIHKKIMSVWFSILLVFSIFLLSVSSVAASFDVPVDSNPNPDTIRVVGRQMHIHVAAHHGSGFCVFRDGVHIETFWGSGTQTRTMVGNEYRVQLHHAWGRVHVDRTFRAASVVQTITIPQFNITVIPMNVTIPQQNITHTHLNLTDMGRVALNRTVFAITNILRLF